jgi:hypothetical protein
MHSMPRWAKRDEQADLSLPNSVQWERLVRRWHVVPRSSGTPSIFKSPVLTPPPPSADRSYGEGNQQDTGDYCNGGLPSSRGRRSRSSRPASIESHWRTRRRSSSGRSAVTQVPQRFGHGAEPFVILIPPVPKLINARNNSNIADIDFSFESQFPQCTHCQILWRTESRVADSDGRTILREQWSDQADRAPIVQFIDKHKHTLQI